MHKTNREKNNEKIIQYLSGQISETISIDANLDNDYETYEKLVVYLRQHYNSKNYDIIEIKKQELKSKIITLESLKLNMPNSDIIKNVSIQFSIMLAFISVVTSVFRDIINKDISKMSIFFAYIIFVFVGCLIAVYVLIRTDLQQNKENRIVSVAINIHKNVIEEELNKIEKNDEINKGLKEIQKTSEGTLRETQTLKRVFETK